MTLRKDDNDAPSGAAPFRMDLAVSETGHSLVLAPVSRSAETSDAVGSAAAAFMQGHRADSARVTAQTLRDARLQQQVRQLRPKLQWVARGVLALFRVLRELFGLLTSAPFVVVLSMPFALWATLLMLVQQQYPDKAALAVAAGPMLLVSIWSTLSLMWAGVAGAAGRVRHGLAVGLGVVALVVVSSFLPRTPPDRPGAAPVVGHP